MELDERVKARLLTMLKLNRGSDSSGLSVTRGGPSIETDSSPRQLSDEEDEYFRSIVELNARERRMASSRKIYLF